MVLCQTRLKIFLVLAALLWWRLFFDDNDRVLAMTAATGILVTVSWSVC
jgi:hypothetical protein